MPSSSESTTFTDRISAWYSVAQSSSVASPSESAMSPASVRVRPSTRSSTPDSRSSFSTRGRYSVATSECTSSVSIALQTDGRWTFALTAILTASSTSADASTSTWQTPADAYRTGTVACSFKAFLRPSPPRGITRSTTPSCVASWRSSSRSPPLTIEIAPSGSPAHCTAPAATCASTAFECAAVDDPRSTIAFPDFRHSAEQSTVTFGRASYTTATTPSGTRTRRTSRPFSSRWPSIVSPTGSGSAAIDRTSEAIPASRSSVSFKRSSRPEWSLASSPASMSRAFAARISPTRSSSAAAIASSAAFFVPVSSFDSSREARFACAHTSATDWAATAIAGKGIVRPERYSLRRRTSRAGHRPPPSREAPRACGQPGGDQGHESDPHADDPPVERERQQRDRQEYEPRRAQHRPHQEPRVAGADKHSIEGEDRPVRRLHQREERPYLLGAVDHSRVAREGPGQRADERQHDQREDRADGDRPTDHPQRGVVGALVIAGPERATHDDLACDRYRVEHEGEEHEELERDLVRPERIVADPRQHRARHEERAIQRGGPDEDLAADAGQRPHPLERRPARVCRWGEQRAHECSAHPELGDHSRPRRARQPPPEPVDEQEVQRHVRRVGGHHDDERGPEVGHPPQPALPSERDQRKRQADRADSQVHHRQLAGVPLAAHQIDERHRESGQERGQTHA